MMMIAVFILKMVKAKLNLTKVRANNEWLEVYKCMPEATARESFFPNAMCQS